jgi:hypothetical protein
MPGHTRHPNPADPHQMHVTGGLDQQPGDVVALAAPDRHLIGRQEAHARVLL